VPLLAVSYGPPPTERLKPVAGDVMRATKGRIGALVLGCLALVPVAAVAAPARYDAGGWQVVARDGSGTASKPGKKAVTLWRKRREPSCNGEVHGKILSIVGSVVSWEVRESGMCEGAAHPYESRTWTTRDLDRNADLSLYEIFGKATIDKALADDKFLADSKNDPDADCKFTLDAFDKHFAFFDVKPGQVAVRIGLGYGCEAMRSNFTQLGWWLNAPAAWHARASEAASQGTLLNTLAKRK
jgi:hypothetical protein